MTEFNPSGIEHKVSGSGLVPIGGKLPNYIEVQTAKLLDVFLDLYQNHELDRSTLRKKINDWLYRRTKPRFYMELNDHLHLAYADQRGGSGTQHWWRLFFDDSFKQRVENATRTTALAVYDQGKNGHTHQTVNANVNPPKEWGGMYFRSESEIKIAEQLDKRGILFFANARGRISGEGSPASVNAGLTGRLEIDFLVFHKGKCITLEVGG